MTTKERVRDEPNPVDIKDDRGVAEPRDRDLHDALVPHARTPRMCSAGRKAASHDTDDPWCEAAGSVPLVAARCHSPHAGDAPHGRRRRLPDVEAWWRWSRLATGLTLIVVLYFAVPVRAQTAGATISRLLISVLVLAALAYVVAVLVRLHLTVDDRRIDGLVLALAAGVLVFALGFYAIDLHDPRQIPGLHTRLDALYFAMSTVSTIGYGDVHAHGQLARAVVLVQMVFDVVVLTAAATT